MKSLVVQLPMNFQLNNQFSGTLSVTNCRVAVDSKSKATKKAKK